MCLAHCSAFIHLVLLLCSYLVISFFLFIKPVQVVVTCLCWCVLLYSWGLTELTTAPNTGKNDGFPFLDILGYLKNTHKNPKFGKVRQIPIRELGWEFPNWDFFSLCQIWDFYGYSLNTLKYPKMGIRYFFLCNHYLTQNWQHIFWQQIITPALMSSLKAWPEVALEASNRQKLPPALSEFASYCRLLCHSVFSLKVYKKNSSVSSDSYSKTHWKPCWPFQNWPPNLLTLVTVF